MTNINLPSINNLPLQNFSILNLPPLKLNHEPSNLFYCRDCPKIFNRKNSLVRHLRAHSGVKPYLCKICSKSFSRKDILAKHKESTKCIENTHAFNTQQRDVVNKSESDCFPIPSLSYNQSVMSISSLVSDTSSSLWKSDDCMQYSDYGLISIDDNELVLHSQIQKSNFIQYSSSLDNILN